MIPSEQISVVIQGPIKGTDGQSRSITFEVIRSVRFILPNSQIIVSTWDGENTTQIPGSLVDDWIFSKDPGGQLRADGVRFNVNRQIVSTTAGIEKAKNPYTLKLRSDTVLISNRFLDFWDRFPQRSPHCQFFKNRVLAPELYFRSPLKSPFGCLFHISDLCQFGNTVDLLNLWRCPLVTNEDASAVGDFKPWPNIQRFEMVPGRFTEEQYVWMNFLRRNGLDIEMKWLFDVDARHAYLSELSIINNFVILTVEDMGIAIPPHVFNFAPRSVYTHEDWIALLEIYCNPTNPPLKTQESVIARNAEILQAYKKRIGN